jgi:hypothetical protein
VFLLSPNSCAKPWSDSGDRELTRGCCSSRASQPDRSDRCCSPVTSLTGVVALWVLPRVNFLVCSLLSRVAVVSSMVHFGARKVRWLLVPRTSSTLVAALSWPTWVVESETCFVSNVRLVGVPISFKKNFYLLPFTLPLSGSPFGPSKKPRTT